MTAQAPPLLANHERICTALGEPGSTQFLTLEFALPSSAVEGGYEFTVAGTDATLPVVGGRLALGTWQFVVVVDTNRDNPRRTVRLSFLG